MNSIGGVGELAALGAAMLWAIASVIYARLGQALPPAVLNLLKGLMALGFLALTLGLRELWQPGSGLEEIAALGDREKLLLTVSGVIGISIGDTCYFNTLNRLGARRALLLETLSPPLTAGIAWIFLGEALGGLDWLGIGLILGGVAWVMVERVPDRSLATAVQIPTKSLLAGVLWAVGANLSQSAGAVMSRSALADTAVDPLWSTIVRLSAGVVALAIGLGLAAIGRWSRDRVRFPLPRSRRTVAGDVPIADLPMPNPPISNGPSSPLPVPQLPVPQLPAPQLPVPQLPIAPNPQNRPPFNLSAQILATIAVVSFFSTYLALWLQQTAFKYAETGIAQTLSSTSPLFVLPVAIAVGERVTVRALVGAAVAIAGVVVLLQSSP
ncbi:DMT family transporter [Prochlorothrix hollandica]|uniref:DMT family transporter n=1 Tax=Prochlorothrix hollandica TaxID=1223 RepID=UPI00333E95C1